MVCAIICQEFPSLATVRVRWKRRVSASPGTGCERSKRPMSGHSKWHNIRLRKGAQDAKRGNLFTKLAKEIILAAKAGGGNPDSNLRLRLSIQKAREHSMPADNIKRSVQRGTGEIEGAVFEELTY